MNKYKVCVYAICKNESKFIERWIKSMSEADAIYVLDTGSTDDSAEILKKLGANVKIEKINPWRFDVARNKSLDMVPLDTDICVCTDLDEIFESGWRKKLENIWNIIGVLMSMVNQLLPFLLKKSIVVKDINGFIPFMKY